MKNKPSGELTIQVLAMPADTNPSGDIFGGWILSQMDIAGGQFCRRIVKGKIVTVAVHEINFKLPVFVGDALCCYVKLVKIGNTSITVHIEAWAHRELENFKLVKVTEGDYTYVKVNKDRKPEKINPVK
jgi:acyl-CoA thioesterase YciA